ncbi:FUSC family protein [uncultured Cedecea sp.]|uniref:FUSC family protein n=1 Tax=uncultured Cedecea sp. TaxID=988762 RepID=UPI002639B19B|nr:FUSC family protein [uncultured Cedecea sp.]
MNVILKKKSQIANVSQSHWRWGRAIRAAVSIFIPFIYGLLSNDIMTGMWIGMGCLMMITGETTGTYRYVCSRMVLSAIIGSLGYLVGYLNELSWSLVILSMMFFGAASQFLSRINHTLSIGMLQFLLLASIALGVPSIENFWKPSILYLVGTLLYIIILSLEFLIRNIISSPEDKKDETPPPSVNKEPPQAKESKYISACTLALCLGVAYSMHLIDNNPHWFWIPLTVGLVIKPDLGPMQARAPQRIIGTFFGVIIGAIVLILIPKNIYFVTVMSIFSFVLPWAMSRSYVLQAVFLTPLILLLINIIQPGSNDINYAVQRLIDTIIGGGIVMVGYYISCFFRCIGSRFKLFN